MQVLKALNKRQLLKPFSTAFQHQTELDSDYSAGNARVGVECHQKIDYTIAVYLVSPVSFWSRQMDENDIEVLPDGRIVLVLHSGRVERPMSTHEVKQAFIDALRKGSGEYLFEYCDSAAVIAERSRKLVLK